MNCIQSKTQASVVSRPSSISKTVCFVATLDRLPSQRRPPTRRRRKPSPQPHVRRNRVLVFRIAPLFLRGTTCVFSNDNATSSRCHHTDIKFVDLSLLLASCCILMCFVLENAATTAKPTTPTATTATTTTSNTTTTASQPKVTAKAIEKRLVDSSERSDRSAIRTALVCRVSLLPP